MLQLTKYTTLTLTLGLAQLALAAHNESVLASSDALQFSGTWGAFTSLLPLDSCPPDTIPRVAQPANDTRVSYAFSGGSAAYVSLVLGRDTCRGTFSVDGADTRFASSAGDEMACVVVAGARGLDPGKKHTVTVTLDAVEGADLVCPFIFARFLVTKPGDASSSSSTSAGSSTSQPPAPSDSSTTTNTNGASDTPTGGPAPSETDPPNAANHLESPAAWMAAAALLALIA
ncbi:hypothetical protein AURDEDRAFT_115457 [Auricularia subglabra TFB-10046 SS5]|uniref:Uncharacterized protein n=1 Tax=Auricularia subglabra (strain TFB-10046 / SS5) TaxID=717982 RepID=J0DD75_AURST|nr:hypothetical protein AURDEDRAFT_115457 [Auricularia subglabra TFB-10046 SS5]